MTDPKQKIKIGVVGTSWWADSMYLPALKHNPYADVAAACGRHRGRAEAFAQSWDIPGVFIDHEKMMAEAGIDAVVVATGNDSHYPITMAALKKGLHVLCEKPLALTVDQAAEMAQKAAEAGVKTLVPFTYRFMPDNRYAKQLIEDGFVGRPYHLAMRYYTGYGREGDYRWRFDKAKAGTGVIGDLGSHFLYLARWYFGEISAVTCLTGALVDRPPVDPEGRPYEQLEDSAMFLLEFANGAQGVVHVTCVAHEQTPFGQRHFMEFHGSDGTLYLRNDWDRVQTVHGASAPDGELVERPIPDAVWGGARRDRVHNTYKDVFRKEQHMIGEWVNAIAHDTDVEPNFSDGLAIQKLMAAAEKSAASGCRVEI